MDDPALRALLANEALFDLGNERFEAEGATFVRNREVPDIWDANHVSRITASTPEEIERPPTGIEDERTTFIHAGLDRIGVIGGMDAPISLSSDPLPATVARGARG